MSNPDVEINDSNYTDYLPKGSDTPVADDQYAQVLPPNDEDITDDQVAELPEGDTTEPDQTDDQIKKEDNVSDVTPTTGGNPEPAVTAGVVGAVVSAVLTLLVVFGIPLTPDQTAAILGVVAVVAPLVVSVVTRHFVTPVAKLNG